MKLKRKRYRFPSANGYNAFRTKRSDLQEYASQFRLESERKRYDNIERYVHQEYTMVSASHGGYGSCDYHGCYHFEDRKMLPVLGYTLMYEDVERWSWSTMRKAKSIFNRYIKNEDVFNESYVLIFWETSRMTRTDIIEHANVLMKERCNVPSMPLFNFALEENDKSHLWRLYARRSWLMTFAIGRRLIKIFNVMNPNFEKVYGFKPIMQRFNNHYIK